MKIFGFEINRSSKQKPTRPTDGIEVSIVRPNATPSSKIKSVKINTLSYAQTQHAGRGVFQGGQYDLSEIGKIEDTDAFVRQAFKKKQGLMFKEGFGWSGPNKKTIQYIKTRMAQISRATGIPTLELLKRLGHSLIRTSNAFLVKVRKDTASGGKVRITPDGKTLQPVAGYFPAAPETMTVSIDKITGRILGWRQKLPDGTYKDFKIDDVVHFTIDLREGFIFGTPTIIPVIDDVRALRTIEENIEVLLHQNLFPLFHFKVGTETAPAGYTEDGTREIEDMETQIQLMPAEGAIVTSERAEITAIGSEGRAIRAEGYLEHFKKRVIAGLGISQVDLGDGDTTNRATANTMSRALIDSVKDIQDSFEAQFDYCVVSELLMESTLGDDVLEEENMVHLSFAEIDIDSKIEREKHSLEQFQGNAITYDELRSDLSREPILVPEDPHDQDLSKYPEWAMTYFKLIEEPLTLMKSMDEPWTAAALAASEARSLGVTNKQLQQAGAAKDKEVQKTAEEDRKTKVAVAKARPVVKTKDNFLNTSFKDLESDSVDRLNMSLSTKGIVDREYLLGFARVWSEDVNKKLSSVAVTQMIRGFNDQTGQRASEDPLALAVARADINRRVFAYLDRLSVSVVDLIMRRIDPIAGDVKLPEVQREYIQELHIAFDSVRYRLDFIWNVEIRKAYNFGRILGLRFLGQDQVELVAGKDACDRCLAVSGQILEPHLVTIDDVIPHHANCDCGLQLVAREIKQLD